MFNFIRICDHTIISSFFPENPIIIDLGLNRGEFTLGILAKFNGKVIGAEPVPELFNKLPFVKGFTAINVAIAGFSGNIELQLNKNRCATVEKQLKEAYSVKISVKSITLDDLISLYLDKNERIDLVKMDIEGSEFTVLRSLSDESLQKIGMFTVEYHDFLDKSLHSDFIDVDKKLISKGFWRIRWSLDNTDVLYVNLNNGWHTLNALERLYIYINKYIFGFRRILSRMISKV